MLPDSVPSAFTFLPPRPQASPSPCGGRRRSFSKNRTWAGPGRGHPRLVGAQSRCAPRARAALSLHSPAPGPAGSQASARVPAGRSGRAGARRSSSAWLRAPAPAAAKSRRCRTHRLPGQGAGRRAEPGLPGVRQAGPRPGVFRSPSGLTAPQFREALRPGWLRSRLGRATGAPRVAAVDRSGLVLPLCPGD